MKNKILKLILAACVFAAVSCGSGTNVFFGPDGITVTPPTQSIIIPTK